MLPYLIGNIVNSFECAEARTCPVTLVQMTVLDRVECYTHIDIVSAVCRISADLPTPDTYHVRLDIPQDVTVFLVDV
jgi:hypothetical protein